MDRLSRASNHRVNGRSQVPFGMQERTAERFRSKYRFALPTGESLPSGNSKRLQSICGLRSQLCSRRPADFFVFRASIAHAGTDSLPNAVSLELGEG